jgi:hypothetical protein
MSALGTVLGWFGKEAAVVAALPAVAQSNDIIKTLALVEVAVTTARAAFSAPTLQAEILDGLSCADALAKIAAEFIPQAAIAEIPIETLSLLVPYLTPLMTLNLISDGKGGWYSPSWAKNPRHQLDEKGRFIA